MANQIEVLKQTELLGQQFEVYGTPQEPLFKAKDVALMLGLTNQRDFVQRVDEDERCKLNLPPQGETWMLTENGLYEVLMQSRKPIAKQFKKGVKTILKEIRTNGGYVATTQEDTPEMIMARALQVAQSTIERHKQRIQMLEDQNTKQQEQIVRLAPKAEYTDAVLQSTSTYTFTQIAHDLGMRSVRVLMDELKSRKMIYRQSDQWQPTAKVADKGYFATRTAKYIKSDGSIGTSISTVVTESGRQFIHTLISK